MSLELRKQIKNHKPTFIKQDHHKRGEIKKRWRRARGLHSKTRLHKKGYQRGPEVGFGSPASVKWLTKHGLKERVIYSVKDLDTLDAKKDCAAIAKSVGMKKRVEIVKKAEELKIKITNIKKNFLEESKKKLDEKKHVKAEQEKKKEKKKEAKEKKKTIDELTDDEKKKAEKAEKDKVLTRKEK